MQRGVSNAIFTLIFLGSLPVQAQAPAPANWNPKAAAAYLDQRASWWISWPRSARDNGTFCVSCHTAVPYALGRAALHRDLGETSPVPNEQKIFDNVVRRVRMWKEAEPFYPDQTSGLPKSSESRGTESILNALILVSRDARSGKLSEDARKALDNMWALQLKSGDTKGSWAWLQFHNAPFEGDSDFYGSALAAVAVGTAPGDYQAEAAIQPGLNMLRTWLQNRMDKQPLLDRAVFLWSSAKLHGLLTEAQQKKIIAEILEKQQIDGSFSMSALVGTWKRRDNSPLDEQGDGYATGLIALAFKQAGLPEAQDAVKRALAWLSRNQNPSDGRWAASSLNRHRELDSDAGRFMSDAATAYAVLALEKE